MECEYKMGCNCGGKKSASYLGPKSHRQTVYQVLGSDSAVVDEFNTLTDARSKATEVGGRVKVTSKITPA